MRYTCLLVPTQTEVEYTGSIVSVQLQCRLHVHCRYTATCWQCMCSVQKCCHKRPFCSVFAVYTANFSVPAVYLQCSSNVHAVYLHCTCIHVGLSNYSVHAVYVQCRHSIHCGLQCVSSVRVAYTAGTLHRLQCSCSVHCMALQVPSTSVWELRGHSTQATVLVNLQVTIIDSILTK